MCSVLEGVKKIQATPTKKGLITSYGFFSKFSASVPQHPFTIGVLSGFSHTIRCSNLGQNTQMFSNSIKSLD